MIVSCNVSILASVLASVRFMFFPDFRLSPQLGAIALLSAAAVCDIVEPDTKGVVLTPAIPCLTRIPGQRLDLDSHLVNNTGKALRK